jgi:hypothetical protein
MTVFVAGSGVPATPQAPGSSVPSPPPVVSAASPPAAAAPGGAQIQATAAVPAGAPAEADTRPRCGLATASLVFGILAVCCFGWLAAVPSILCGALALKQCKEQNLSGEGRAKFGIVLAVVAIISSKFEFNLPFPHKAWKAGQKVVQPIFDR